MDEISRQIEFLENDPSKLETPISITLDLQNLRGTGDSNSSGAQHLLPLLEDISGAVHSNSNEITRLREAGLSERRQSENAWQPGIHRAALQGRLSHGFIASVGSMRTAYPWLCEMGLAAYTRVIAGDID